MVTIKDIARALGVSPSTVTRALAGNRRISAETIRRVREQAEAMGYVVDAAARAMQSGTSALVGLLLPDIQNSFYATMARTAAEHCRRRGYQLVLSVTEDDAKVEEQHVRALIGARCAGVLLVPTGRISEPSCRLLSAVPRVQLVRRAEALNAAGFGIDDRRALATACGYLLDLGHRRIGLLVGDDSLDTARARRAGFLDAFAARGLSPDLALIRTGPPRAAHGRQGTAGLLATDPMPTAVVAAGAALSEGMLDAVAAHAGDSAPAVSLLGFGDNPAFRWWRGDGLSAITMPIAEIAAAACECLFGQIAAPAGAEASPPFATLDTALVLRGSTCPPAWP